jgi:peptidoglycan/xylan/chitin deacetylase (PgdA/CDA1 family)
MRNLPYHPLRDFVYGDPGRAVPWLTVALGLGVGLLTRSPGAGLATVVLGGQVWDRMSPRMVVEDPRLGEMTLTCPRRADGGGKQLWLTFDDGPGPETDAVLDILQEYEAAATFFFIGERVARCDNRAALRERLLRAGHKVGNHSWSHPNFLRLPSEQARQEVVETQRMLAEAFPGSVLPIFRPPYGYRTECLFHHVRAIQLSMIGWSVNSLDFLSGSAECLIDRVLSRTQPGSILLFHDGPEKRARTVEALPAILSGLKAQGYVFGVPEASP